MDFKNWRKVIINQVLCNKDLDSKNLIGETYRSLKTLVMGLNFEHNIRGWGES